MTDVFAYQGVLQSCVLAFFYWLVSSGRFCARFVCLSRRLNEYSREICCFILFFYAFLLSSKPGMAQLRYPMKKEYNRHKNIDEND